MLALKPPSPEETPATVVVAGIGGAGIQVLDRLVLNGLQESRIIAMDTDIRKLESSVVPEKIPLGIKVTRGLDSGGDPEIGALAVASSQKEILDALGDSTILFIISGLGGGTGTGGAPELARLAAEKGCKVIALVTLPFEFEGRRRAAQAEAGLNKLVSQADALYVLPGDAVLSLIGDSGTVFQAFELADSVLGQISRGLCHLLSDSGFLRVEWPELTRLLEPSVREPGRACWVGWGESATEDRASEVVETALKGPFLSQQDLRQQADEVLISITGGPNMLFGEVDLIVGRLRAEFRQDCKIQIATRLDPDRGDELSLLVIASKTIVKNNIHSSDRILPAPHTESSAEQLSDVRKSPVNELKLVELPINSKELELEPALELNQSVRETSSKLTTDKIDKQLPESSESTHLEVRNILHDSEVSCNFVEDESTQNDKKNLPNEIIIQDSAKIDIPILKQEFQSDTSEPLPEQEKIQESNEKITNKLSDQDSSRENIESEGVRIKFELKESDTHVNLNLNPHPGIAMRDIPNELPQIGFLEKNVSEKIDDQTPYFKPAETEDEIKPTAGSLHPVEEEIISDEKTQLPSNQSDVLITKSFDTESFNKSQGINFIQEIESDTTKLQNSESNLQTKSYEKEVTQNTLQEKLQEEKDSLFSYLPKIHLAPNAPFYASYEKEEHNYFNPSYSNTAEGKIFLSPSNKEKSDEDKKKALSEGEIESPQIQQETQQENQSSVNLNQKTYSGNLFPVDPNQPDHSLESGPITLKPKVSSSALNTAAILHQQQIPRQESLNFEVPTRGRFEKTDATLYNGENLDIPTFVRKQYRVRQVQE